MATQPVASSLALTVEEISALPITANASNRYCPTQRLGSRLIMAPGYRNLSEATEDYVISLTEKGQPKIAERVANCGKHGTAASECPKGHFAHVDAHFCGDILCERLCGKGYFRMDEWLSRRDPDALYASSQVGVELFIPAFVPEFHTNTQRVAIWEEAHERIKSLLPEFLEKMGVESALRSSACPSLTQASIRTVIEHSGINTHKTTKLWKSIAGPGAECKFVYSDGVTGSSHINSLLLWAFSGWEDFARSMQCGDLRSEFRIAMRGTKQVSAYGTFYKAMTPEAIKARNQAEREGRTCEHPDCRGKHMPMRTIPKDERHTQTMAELESRYEIIQMQTRSRSVIRKVYVASTDNVGQEYASP